MDQANTLTPQKWGFLKKFLFRFFFSFCYVSLFPIISGLFWPQLIEWSSSYFFTETVTYHPSGSGDTLYDFYELVLKIIVAFIAAIIWSVLDRKRNSYTILLYWQEVYIRYYLAFFLLVYGLMKVIKLQFGQPPLSSLLIPLGYKSPMGLAWTFMGHSDIYTIFSGLCEVAAAGFLLYRKTRTLGAIIGFGVMLNVFLMNMSYDIPVKLFSFQLVLLSAFLIGLDYKRLISVFILNRPALPQQSHQLFPMQWANIVTQIVKIVAITAGLGFTVYNNLQNQAKYGDDAPKPPLYGIYEVEEFILNNDTVAPMLNDTIRWRYLVFEKYYTNVFNMKTKHYDELQYFTTKTDTLKKEVLFLRSSDSAQVGKLYYKKTGSNRYMFNGIFNNDSLKLHTIRTDEKDFPLMNRGFHWINEYPYNR